MPESDDPIWTRWSPRAVRALSASTILVVVFLWWLVTSQGWVRPLFLPGPGRVISNSRFRAQNVTTWCGCKNPESVFYLFIKK